MGGWLVSELQTGLFSVGNSAQCQMLAVRQEANYGNKLELRDNYFAFHSSRP